MKKNTLLKLLAIIATLSLMLACFAGCGGNDKDGESTVESGNNLLIGDAVDTDDGDDEDVSDNPLITGQGGSTGGSAGGSTGGSTGGSAGGSANNATSGGIQIDEEAKQSLLDSIPKSLKGQTVKVLIWWQPQDFEKAKAAAFEKATGIKIKWITASDAYYSKLSAMIGQDNAPDLACIQQGNFPSAVIQNYFEPISKGKFNLNDGTFDLDTMNTYKWNNQYYGAVVKGSSNLNFTVMYFNKDLFAKNGVQSPYDLWQSGNWNWDTMCDIATEIQKKAGLTNAITSKALEINDFVLTAGVSPVIFDNGKIINNLKNATYVNAWKSYRDMQFNKKIIGGNSTSDFYNQKAAMVVGGTYLAQKNGDFQNNVKFNLGFAPLPSPKGSNLYVPTNLQLWGFGRGAKNIEAASYWLQYWQSPVYDVKGHEVWQDDATASFNNWLWNQNKTFETASSIIQYGGNNKIDTFYSALNTPSTNVDTVISQWYDTVDSNIKKILK